MFAQQIPTYAQGTIPQVSFEVNGSSDPKTLSSSIELLIIFTLMALLPSIIIMMTAFTRILIVLSFVKNALGLQQNLPGQIIIGLSIFLTIFVMGPTTDRIYKEGLHPYFEKKITQEEAITRSVVPLKEFMLKQTRKQDLDLFYDLAKQKPTKDVKAAPLRIVTPAFLISELKSAFEMGFIIFIPFLIVDMVVASTLMSMGMMMLPPVMISLPFKILLFILADGWDLVVKSIIMGFK